LIALLGYFGAAVIFTVGCAVVALLCWRMTFPPISTQALVD